MSENIYLDRYAWQDPLFPAYEPSHDLEIVIVIPAYKEEHLLAALDSINNCIEPKAHILLLIVINESESATQEITDINQKCHESLKNYVSKFDLIYTYQKLPAKKAGVGLARKIGMDEAVRFFEILGKNGVIVCYDADCLCQKNYLVEIENSFSSRNVKAGIVFFEHQLDGANHDAILEYELYLRYYINALRFAGFPFAHQTLGSCIAIRSSTYQKQGGMNTRKAGEDFYFLNKVIPLGGFYEINTTTVYPSDRTSDRVPFGTGKAVSHLLELNDSYKVYHPRIFSDLKQFFNQVSRIYQDEQLNIPNTVAEFLGNDLKNIVELRKQTASETSFKKRFFHWFDAFKILKYVHFAKR